MVDAGMMKRILALVVLMLAVLVLTAFSEAAADDGPVETMLPVPGFSEGWAAVGKTGLYGPENLYVYINGEAELFIPYGFEALASVFYGRGGDPGSGIVADVYRMRSLIDAFGIYSNYRDADAGPVKVGAEGFADGSQLMFYKGRYFVRLSVSGTLNGPGEALIGCAQAIAAKIPGTPARPEALDMLDIPGVAPGTVRYHAASVLGYAFFQKGLSADIAIDGEPAKIFIVFCGSSEASSAAFDQYADYLKAAGTVVERTGDAGNDTLKVHDPLYKGTIIRVSGSYVFGVTKLRNPLNALPLIDRVQSRLK